MKTRFAFTPHRLIFLMSLALTLAVRSANGGAVQTWDLVLTETSSTSLSLSYNGPSGNSAFSVNNTSADHWTVTINSAEINFGTFIHEWTEPEGANAVNKVVFTPATNPFAFFVTSDLPLLLDGDAAPQPNNTRSATPIGFDVDQSNQVFLTFNDVGEASETAVPDTGSTLGLFALACVLLFGAFRMRSARSA